jgi:hypothetical protein
MVPFKKYVQEVLHNLLASLTVVRKINLVIYSKSYTCLSTGNIMTSSGMKSKTIRSETRE